MHDTHRFAIRAIAFEGLHGAHQVALVTRIIPRIERAPDILRALERFHLVKGVEGPDATPEAILSSLTPLGAEVRGVLLDSILTSGGSHWMLERAEWAAWSSKKA